MELAQQRIEPGFSAARVVEVGMELVEFGMEIGVGGHAGSAESALKVGDAMAGVMTPEKCLLDQGLGVRELSGIVCVLEPADHCAQPPGIVSENGMIVVRIRGVRIGGERSVEIFGVQIAGILLDYSP